ncbi:MAG: DUF3108 domain-containing protein [Patescibacteria group bacterium]
MKKILFMAIIVLIIASVIASLGNNPESILTNMGKPKGSSGIKRLHYKVYLFGVLPVGTAVLGDNGVGSYKGASARHLSAIAQSSEAISRIYPFQAALDAYLDTKTLLPLFFSQRLTSAGKEIIKEVSYDQKNGIMEKAGVRRNIEPNTYEPLSLLLKIRSMDLSKEGSFDFNINNNQKNYAFQGAVAKGRKFFTLKAKIFRRDKNQYHRSEVTFVLSPDLENAPVLIKVFASGAFLTARLTGIE